MNVVVAEKPSVARDLAKVLGANQRKTGYLEGNGWQVTWALGHLASESAIKRADAGADKVGFGGQRDVDRRAALRAEVPYHALSRFITG